MDILINPPKEIFVTKEEFMNYSYYDLACFWCNWRVAFCFDDDNNIKAYTNNERLCYRCCRNYRFKNIKWYEIEVAEMFTCTIPKENELRNLVLKYFNHLIMK